MSFSRSLSLGADAVAAGVGEGNDGVSTVMRTTVATNQRHPAEKLYEGVRKEMRKNAQENIREKEMKGGVLTEMQGVTTQKPSNALEDLTAWFDHFKHSRNKENDEYERRFEMGKKHFETLIDDNSHFKERLQNLEKLNSSLRSEIVQLKEQLAKQTLDNASSGQENINTGASRTPIPLRMGKRKATAADLDDSFHAPKDKHVFLTAREEARKQMIKQKEAEMYEAIKAEMEGAAKLGVYGSNASA